MKRIAIVACENSNTVCAGCACLNAFYDRRKSFERYAGEELRLMACCACLNAFYAEITSYINKTSLIEGGGTTKS